MSEDVYVLKELISFDALRSLNHSRDKSKIVENLWHAIGNLDKGWPQFDQVEDMIAALKSGKKIVNPMSPREELEKFRETPVDVVSPEPISFNDIIDTVIEIIAKEHPDVKDWLKDGDTND